MDALPPIPMGGWAVNPSDTRLFFREGPWERTVDGITITTTEAKLVGNHWVAIHVDFKKKSSYCRRHESPRSQLYGTSSYLTSAT